MPSLHRETGQFGGRLKDAIDENKQRLYAMTLYDENFSVEEIMARTGRCKQWVKAAINTRLSQKANVTRTLSEYERLTTKDGPLTGILTCESCGVTRGSDMYFFRRQVVCGDCRYFLRSGKEPAYSHKRFS